MSSINPAVRHCVPEFLRAIENIKLGEREAAHIVEHRKMMSVSVATFVVHGNQNDLDLGDMLVSELAMATIALCDDPLNQAAIDAFVKARQNFIEMSGAG